MGTGVSKKKMSSLYMDEDVMDGFARIAKERRRSKNDVFVEILTKALPVIQKEMKKSLAVVHIAIDLEI